MRQYFWSTYSGLQMHILLILKESQTSSFELSQDIKSSFPICRYHPSKRQTRGQEMVEKVFQHKLKLKTIGLSQIGREE